MKFPLFILCLFLSFDVVHAQTTEVVISHDVNVGEYIVFLKAAASLSDRHGLYNSIMGLEIDQSPELFWHTYFIANGARANEVFINYNIMQERRYCNWVEHGSPKICAIAEASTETGAYDLTGPEVIINPGAKHHLLDEEGYTFTIVTRVDNPPKK